MMMVQKFEKKQERENKKEEEKERLGKGLTKKRHIYNRSGQEGGGGGTRTRSVKVGKMEGLAPKAHQGKKGTEAVSRGTSPT